MEYIRFLIYIVFNKISDNEYNKDTILKEY